MQEIQVALPGKAGVPIPTSVRYIPVSKQWVVWACQSFAFLSCAQMVVHLTALWNCANAVGAPSTQKVQKNAI